MGIKNVSKLACCTGKQAVQKYFLNHNNLFQEGVMQKSVLMVMAASALFASSNEAVEKV